MYVFNKHLYYVYIVTNHEKTVLYTGVTNNLVERLKEHYLNKGQSKTFAGKFFCYNLIYYEEFDYVRDAIAREKELKGWTRGKKEELVKTKNPDGTFLNKKVSIHWPPKDRVTRY